MILISSLSLNYIILLIIILSSLSSAYNLNINNKIKKLLLDTKNSEMKNNNKMIQLCTRMKTKPPSSSQRFISTPIQQKKRNSIGTRYWGYNQQHQRYGSSLLKMRTKTTSSTLFRNKIRTQLFSVIPSDSSSSSSPETSTKKEIKNNNRNIEDMMLQQQQQLEQVDQQIQLEEYEKQYHLQSLNIIEEEEEEVLPGTYNNNYQKQEDSSTTITNNEESKQIIEKLKIKQQNEKQLSSSSSSTSVKPNTFFDYDEEFSLLSYLQSLGTSEEELLNGLVSVPKKDGNWNIYDPLGWTKRFGSRSTNRTDSVQKLAKLDINHPDYYDHNINQNTIYEQHEYKDVTIVRTVEDAKIVLNKLYEESAQNVFHACDTEVMDIDLKKVGPVSNGYVTCVSIYSGPNFDYGLRPDKKKGTTLWIDNIDEAYGVINVFKEWFEDAKYLKIWHNYGFDRHVMFNEGIDVRGLAGDTMHMARLQDTSRTRPKINISKKSSAPNKNYNNGYNYNSVDSYYNTLYQNRNNNNKPSAGGGAITSGTSTTSEIVPKKDTKTTPVVATATSTKLGYSLEALIDELLHNHEEYSSIKKSSMKDIFGVPRLRKDGTPGSIIDIPPVEQMQRVPQFRPLFIEYSCRDAKGTYYLHEALKEKLMQLDWFEDKNLYEYYYSYMRPFAVVLTDMERRGIYIDAEYLHKVEQHARQDRITHSKIFRNWVCKNYVNRCANNVGNDYDFLPIFNGLAINPASSIQLQTLLFGGTRNDKTREETEVTRTFKVPTEEIPQDAMDALFQKKQNITNDNDDIEYTMSDGTMNEIAKELLLLNFDKKNNETSSSLQSYGKAAVLHGGKKVEPKNDDLDYMSSEQLKILLKSLGLKLSGKKEELRDRIRDHLQNSINDDNNDNDTSSVDIIVDGDIGNKQPQRKEEIEKDLSNKKVVDLKDMLREYKLKLSGKKSVLIERLVDYLVTHPQQMITSDSTTEDNKNINNDTTMPVSQEEESTIVLQQKQETQDGTVVAIEEVEQENIIDEFEAMSDDCLRHSLITRGLTTIGTRDELLKRMRDDLEITNILMIAEEEASPIPDMSAIQKSLENQNKKNNQDEKEKEEKEEETQKQNDKRTMSSILNITEALELLANEQEKKYQEEQEYIMLYGKEQFDLVKEKESKKKKITSYQNISNVLEDVKSKKLLEETPKHLHVTIQSLGIFEPEKFTMGGSPSVTADVLKKMAGDPYADPPKYGTAYEACFGGDRGRETCVALHSLYSIGSIDTMIGNFFTSLQLLKDEQSRVHGSLNLNTETGRLSSRRPNLQNQPALEKDKYQIRKAFQVSSNKNNLIVADYGQLELRLLASMTDCKSMIDAFLSGVDFHSRTAVDMFDYIQNSINDGDCILDWDYNNGEPDKPLVKDQYASERRKAKTLNFSIAYGKTAHGLSLDWGVTIKEAEEMLNKWYDARPEVREWQNEKKEIARKDGYTRTLMGRYRQLQEAQSKNRKYIGQGERASINTPIQGGAADVAMMAMLKINNSIKLKRLGWILMLQIHDEVILEGPAETAQEAFDEVINCMENPWVYGLDKTKVPLLVDGSYKHKNWYEAK